MKKTTKPATAPKAVKKAATKKATAKTEGGTSKSKAVAAPKKSVTAAKSEPAAPKTTPAPAAPAPKPTPKAATIITARIDVGFGNVLFIRGEGPGLTWDKGVPMECKGADEWSWSSSSSASSFPYKFLINDDIWSDGDDYIAVPNKPNVVIPNF